MQVGGSGDQTMKTSLVGGGIHKKSSILEQILLLWHKIRCFAKELKRFDEVWPLYLTFEILKIPIIGSKIKVVVKSIYGYQNLSGEKYKSNEKRISSIGHTSEEKNPKNHPKMPFFWNLAFPDGFLDFSLHWYVRLS